jgi:hypothetical protein
MSLFIEGTAFPLGVLNTNSWGIPFAEADNAIKSLKTSVVRICSRIDPHLCDYMGDPASEIGHAVDAGRDGDNVSCKAEITDSIAVQKIEDGTWKPFWSIFASTQDIDSGGWIHGVAIESITLVNNPAWDTAKWSVVSASNDGTKRFHITSPFKIIASEEKQGGENIPDEPTIEDLKAQIAEKDRLIEELTPKAESVPGLETQVAELSASNAEKDKKIKELTAVAASSVPTEKVKEIVAASLADYREEVEKEQERSTAFSAFAAARKNLGIETKEEDFKALSAADLTRLAGDLGTVKLGAGGSEPIQYPAGGSGNKVQIYDPATKTYTEA